MGQSDSRNKQNYQTFLATHTKIQEHKHRWFGEVSIYRNNQDEQILVKEGWAENQQEFETISRRIGLSADFHDPFLNSLRYQNCYIEKEWCSDNFYTCVAYEYHERTLEQELQDRQKMGNSNIRQMFFKEAEIWYML